MTLKELKSLVEEREQLKSEIIAIRKAERSKLSERDRTLLAEIKKTEFFSIMLNQCSFLEIEYPFYSKEIVPLLKEKVTRIKEIEQIILYNLSVFDIEFDEIAEYLKEYFKVKLDIDITVKAENIRIDYDDPETHFDLTIEADGVDYKIATIYTNHSGEYKVVNLVKLIMPDVTWRNEPYSDIRFIINKEKENDAKAFYKTYEDFKNALWYVISASHKKFLQKQINLGNEVFKRKIEKLKNLESEADSNEDENIDIYLQKKEIEQYKIELEILESKSDKYDLD